MKNTREISTYVSIEGPSSGVTNRGRKNYMSFETPKFSIFFSGIFASLSTKACLYLHWHIQFKIIFE